MSEGVKLDWSSAQVHNGKLAVSLDGKPEKAWKEAFKRTAHLLNRGKWEEVSLKRSTVVLQPVVPGGEDRVRHFLESLVLQANTALQTTEEKSAQSDKNDSREKKEARANPEDQEMTERLRAFAEADTED